VTNNRRAPFGPTVITNIRAEPFQIIDDVFACFWHRASKWFLH
jgi:hypothetical protein